MSNRERFKKIYADILELDPEAKASYSWNVPIHGQPEKGNFDRMSIKFLGIERAWMYETTEKVS